LQDPTHSVCPLSDPQKAVTVYGRNQAEMPGNLGRTKVGDGVFHTKKNEVT
jgi:hypothetical protein